MLKQEDGWECPEMFSLGHNTAAAFIKCISERLYESKSTKSANVPTGIATRLGGLPTDEGENTYMEVAGGCGRRRMRMSKADCFHV